MARTIAELREQRAKLIADAPTILEKPVDRLRYGRRASFGFVGRWNRIAQTRSGK
jgi:hypothetical protein